MTAPITAARTGGLSFRLAGIPVTIHVTFVVVIGVLGLGVGDLDRLLVWVVVATVAVLLHELGHALVGRLAGLRPRIDLAGFGGVTSWSAHDHGRGRGQLGRGWSLAISLAGPGLGFVGGFVALAFGAPCCTIPVGADLPGFAAGVWLFASFGWGILNLLPILPLDGGQALRELLPGSPAQRMQRAAVVGAVVGGALVLWAITSGQTYLALLAGWITWSNVQQVRLAGASGTAARTGPRPPGAAEVVARLWDQGRHGEAYRLATDPRGGTTLPTELLGTVIAAHPDRRTVDTVVRGWAARSSDRRSRSIAAMVLGLHGHHDEVFTLVRQGGPVDAPVAVAVQTAAHRAGHHATAAALGWALVAHPDEGLRSPVLAYNTACSLARADRVDEAVQMLSVAYRLGFDDLDLVADDPDLVALHDHPAWPRLRVGEPVVPGRGGRPHDADGAP